jgi:hypothetical protein
MAGEEHRFNWIYAIVDATRWCFTHELTNGQSQTINTFDDLGCMTANLKGYSNANPVLYCSARGIEL